MRLPDYLFSPLTWILLLALLLLLTWRRLPRAARYAGVALEVVLLLLIAPVGANVLVRLIESRVPLPQTCPAPTPTTIVLLDGGTDRRPRSADDYAALDINSLRRLFAAVALWQRIPHARLSCCAAWLNAWVFRPTRSRSRKARTRPGKTPSIPPDYRHRCRSGSGWPVPRCTCRARLAHSVHGDSSPARGRPIRSTCPSPLAPAISCRRVPPWPRRIRRCMNWSARWHTGAWSGKRSGKDPGKTWVHARIRLRPGTPCTASDPSIAALMWSRP